MRIEGQIEKNSTTSKTIKEGERYKNPMEGKYPKKTTTDKSDDITGRNKLKDISERRKIQKVLFVELDSLGENEDFSHNKKSIHTWNSTLWKESLQIGSCSWLQQRR